MTQETSNPVESSSTLEIKTDRVVYGASRKVTDGNYGSYDFHCSLSTDVKPEEQVTDTVNRAVRFVETVLTHKINQTNQKKMGY